MIKTAFIISFVMITFNLFAQKTTPLDSAQLRYIDSLKLEIQVAEILKSEAEKRINALKVEIVKLSSPVYWKKGGLFALNLNQMSFTNWAAGGLDALSVTTLGNMYASYKKDKIDWDNNLVLAYGMIQNRGEDLRKNEDKIDFITKFGHHSPIRNVNFTVFANFRSQFAPAYNYDAQNVRSPLISNFLAPAFVVISLGLDYKPKPYFSVYLSPATGKFTIVNINDNSIKKNFAVDTNKIVRPEFGASMAMFFQKDLTKRINLLSRLGLFNNYTDPNKPNRKNIDVNFEVLIAGKINRFISASLMFNVLYDNDILISYDETNPSKKGPRTQIKEVFGIGLAYKF